MRIFDSLYGRSLVARPLTVAATTLLLSSLGCGRSAPVSYSVRGQVLLNGKPVAEAMVLLHPLQGNVEGGQKPLAFTDREGRFAFTTFQTADGAPPGEYALTVELRAPREVGEETIRDGANLLPSRYARPETSGLRYQVVPGENEIPRIQLAAP